MSHLRRSIRLQRGAAEFKKVVMIAGAGFVLLMVVIVATAPPPKENDDSQAAKNAQTSGQTPAATPSPPTATKDDKAASATVKLPEGFRRFTSNQYRFSVAYPNDWGSPATQRPPANVDTLAATREVTYPIATAFMRGSFSISLARAEFARLPARPGLTVQPVSKDGGVTWRVASVPANEPEYRVGNPYNGIKSSPNPTGINIYDFTWTNEQGRRQARWAFVSDGSYILMSLPSLEGSNGGTPTGAELSFYSDFAQDVINTVAIPEVKNDKN